jgi:crotonobetainyl-CoA:carnitine CoA-transferase CaiB-like acyl-CoA transferase
VGALIELSLMESLLDFQFELLTTFYASNQQPKRSYYNNGHPLLSAPYGLYKTTDGYIALAMMDIKALAKAIDCNTLEKFSSEQTFADRDKIKAELAKHLSHQSTNYWLTHLQKDGLWAMEVFDWEKMMNHDAYKCLQMEQTLNAGDKEIITTRCPIRINGEKLFSDKPAPKLGEHREKILNDFVSW